MEPLLPALLFVGFKHKCETVEAAKALGFTPVLLARKISDKAKEAFDHTYEGNPLDLSFLRSIEAELRSKFDLKGVLSNYEHFVIHRSWVAEAYQIPACSVPNAARTRNKVLQRQALDGMEENLNFKVVNTEDEALEAFNQLGRDVFLKHIAGIKSRLVFNAQSEAQMKTSFNTLQNSSRTMNPDLNEDFSRCHFDFEYPDPCTQFLVEERARGQQITVSSLVGESEIWHTPSVCDIYTAAHLGRDDSFLAFRILPSKLDEASCKKIHESMSHIIQKLELKRCSVFTDLMFEDGKIKVIELASRMGGYRPEMYQAAYDFDLSQALIRAVTGENLKLEPHYKNHVGLVEIFPRQNGVLQEIRGAEGLASDPAVSYLKQLTSFGKASGRAQEGHRPVLRFLIKGGSYEEVYAACLKWQNKIEVVTV